MTILFAEETLLLDDNVVEDILANDISSVLLVAVDLSHIGFDDEVVDDEHDDGGVLDGVVCKFAENGKGGLGICLLLVGRANERGMVIIFLWMSQSLM